MPVSGSMDMVFGKGIFFAFLSPLCKMLGYESDPFFLIHTSIDVRKHLQKKALLPESDLASYGRGFVT